MRWLTSEPDLADELSRGAGRLSERVVKFRDEGSIRLAQVYPPSFVEMVLRAVRRSVLGGGSVSAVELAAAGPVADKADVIHDSEYEEYWDDVNGGFLDPRLTREARRLELDWVMKEKVYSCCRPEDAKDQRPIAMRWVDTNKGDLKSPVVRSRLCVKEQKKGRHRVQSLEPEQLYSAMPPLEALKLLVSMKTTMKVSTRGKPLLIAHFDISRAHFMPKAEREVFVVLPDEDPKKQEGYIGKLERTMYGTQDASNLWQKDYTQLVSANDYVAGKANPALLYSEVQCSRLLVHGDDFIQLGDEDAIEDLHRILASKYTVKLLAVVGSGPAVQEAVVLNRIVRYVPPSGGMASRMELEADQRHVEVLLADLGLDAPHSKGWTPPGSRGPRPRLSLG